MTSLLISLTIDMDVGPEGLTTPKRADSGPDWLSLGIPGPPKLADLETVGLVEETQRVPGKDIRRLRLRERGVKNIICKRL